MNLEELLAKLKLEDPRIEKEIRQEVDGTVTTKRSIILNDSEGKILKEVLQAVNYQGEISFHNGATYISGNLVIIRKTEAGGWKLEISEEKNEPAPGPDIRPL